MMSYVADDNAPSMSCHCSTDNRLPELISHPTVNVCVYIVQRTDVHSSENTKNYIII